MKYSCSVQTQTVYIMEMPQQQRWNSVLLWGRLWEYRGRPMRCLPNTLRILKTYWWFSAICGTTSGIYFLSYRDRLRNIQTFAIWDCAVIQRSGSYKEYQFAFVLLGCSEWWHTSQNQTDCRKESPSVPDFVKERDCLLLYWWTFYSEKNFLLSGWCKRYWLPFRLSTQGGFFWEKATWSSRNVIVFSQE